MQALASVNPEKYSEVDPALRALENTARGIKACSYFSEKGLFARFYWADWPEELCRNLAAEVRDFCKLHNLFTVADASAEWEAVFRGWRPDPSSVAVIALAFSEQFGPRLSWVESQRDGRGRIASQCMIEGIGESTLNLFWRDSLAIPPAHLSGSDLELFQKSVNGVFEWARGRIQKILHALYDRLSSLYADRFRGLYVFGSYARPDAGIELPEDSDLDMALILSDFENSSDEIRRTSDITYDLGLEHSLVISLVPVREADFKEGRTNFTRVISEYAIRVQ